MTLIPTLSVVVPMHNEADSAGPLVEEIARATAALGVADIVCVDDGSTDGTCARLVALKARFPTLRVLVHPLKSGQSAAIVTGVRAATGDLIVTLDGDGQNDPADIPALYAAWLAAKAERESGPLLVAGQRGIRHDDWLRRLSSRMANALRARLLGDGVTDTGCGLKLFSRADFLALPAFNHMHRYLPALYGRAGGRTVLVTVRHRPRARGLSKYGMWDRLWVGIGDLAGVLWLLRRPVDVAGIREEPSLSDVQPRQDRKHATVA